VSTVPTDDVPVDDLPAPAGTGEPPAPSVTRRRRWFIEWGIIIVLAIVAAVLVRAYVFETFFIPSGSMEPTLDIGDRIVVNKLSYDLHAVGRGDIVVFRRPPNEHCGGPPVPDLVKRVIGLPTETIQGRNGGVYVTGKYLPEPWLKGDPYAHTTPFGPLKIPKGDYFMMGDHRTDSCDSRTWGPIPGSYFVGKVDLRIWPLSRIRWF
jgi:signal peptidase I